MNRSSNRGLVFAGFLCLGLIGAGVLGLLRARPPKSVALGSMQDARAAYARGEVSTALLLLGPLAERGEAPAQQLLGEMYHQGRGLPRNDRQAARWWKLAAAQGDADAQNNLGWAYDSGRGLPRDRQEAARCFERAAKQGHPKAQENLGLAYALGRGLPQDYGQAYLWFNLAAATAPGGRSALADRFRRNLAKKMSRAQIGRAQERSRKCLGSNYENCE